MGKFRKTLGYLKFTYLERARHDIKIAFHPQSFPVVSFLGCGVQKAGTTALDNYLRQHQDICLPDRKEIHFFDKEYNFRYPIVDYSKYHSFFDLQPKQKIAGEITPAYIYWEYSPRRIWEYNPKMKIIILLRNPIHRAYSHWNMNKQKNLDTFSFREAITQEVDRSRSSLPFQSKRFSYLDRGLYTHQILRIFRFFPKDQVLILKSSDLISNTHQTMVKIFQFLGVTAIQIHDEDSIHQGIYEEPMDKSDKAFLREYYYSEIKSLEQLLGWDCSDWLVSN